MHKIKIGLRSRPMALGILKLRIPGKNLFGVLKEIIITVKEMMK